MLENNKAPGSKAGLGAKVWCDVGLAPKEGIIILQGILERLDEKGNVLDRHINTATTVYKQKTAQGAAVGSFNAVDKIRFYEAGPTSLDVEVATKVAGGDGTVDYVTYEAEWINDTGSTKTITQMEIGYDLGGGSEAIYAQVTGLSQAVPDTEKVRYRWTLTMAYVSGGVNASYRKALAKMVYDGTFPIPATINFVDTLAATHCENASLEAGGDGVETYHQWTATYTGPVGGKTIDQLILNKIACAVGNEYVEEDITDKALAEGDTLTAHIKITHS